MVDSTDRSSHQKAGYAESQWTKQIKKAAAYNCERGVGKGFTPPVLRAVKKKRLEDIGVGTEEAGAWTPNPQPAGCISKSGDGMKAIHEGKVCII